MEQNLSLVREYVNQHFVEKGMYADNEVASRTGIVDRRLATAESGVSETQRRYR